MLKKLVQQSRSYRRFDESYKVDKETLYQLIELARLIPSAANMQPLKYLLSTSADHNEKIFSCLTWAAALKDWAGPAPGERPTAYIVILGDNSICKEINWDHGIAAQTMMLGAAELGLGGCIFSSVKRARLRELLQIPEQYSILLVLALGKPAEKVVITTVGEDGDTRYWRDENGVHYVPKRSVKELIFDTIT